MSLITDRSPCGPPPLIRDASWNGRSHPPLNGSGRQHREMSADGRDPIGARIGPEVRIERAVLLDDHHDVADLVDPHVGRAHGARCERARCRAGTGVSGRATAGERDRGQEQEATHIADPYRSRGRSGVRRDDFAFRALLTLPPAADTPRSLWAEPTGNDAGAGATSSHAPAPVLSGWGERVRLRERARRAAGGPSPGWPARSAGAARRARRGVERAVHSVGHEPVEPRHSLGG